MEKRMAGDYEIIHAFHIGDKEIVIGENVNTIADQILIVTDPCGEIVAGCLPKIRKSLVDLGDPSGKELIMERLLRCLLVWIVGSILGIVLPEKLV